MLSEQRKKIDAIDHELVRLLEERFVCSKEVAEVKIANQLPVLDESREKALLDKINNLVQNPSYQPYIKEIYETILTESKNYQKTFIDN